MIEAKNIKGSYLSYQGRPLVRQDNELVLGDLSDTYYVYMLIMSEKPTEFPDVKIPDKVVVQLLQSADGKLEKQNTVDSMTEAFETATAWLERYNRT